MSEGFADSRGTFDDCLAALGRVERRRILFDLLEAPECRIDPDWVEAPPGSDPRVPLRHAHLPKLAALGVVEVDAEGDIVRRGLDFEHLRPLLEVLRDHREDLPHGLV